MEDGVITLGEGGAEEESEGEAEGLTHMKLQEAIEAGGTSPLSQLLLTLAHSLSNSPTLAHSCQRVIT